MRNPALTIPSTTLQIRLGLRKMSKRLLLAAGFLAASLTTGFAADMRMPVKAPPIVDPPFSWTGFYVGGNVGYSWGRARTDQSDVLTSTPSLRAFTTGGTELFNVNGIAFPIVGTPAITAGSTSSRSNVNGFIGGVQAGYNWQVDRYWLLGIETDFQGSGERGSNSICSLGCTATGAFGSAATRMDWFGTLRGRIGWLPVERVLLYFTGGLAYASLKTDYVSGITDPNSLLVTGSSRSTRLGYALGGGVEGALDRHWTVKLEYLFMGFDPYSTNLGASSRTVTGPGINFADRVIVPSTTNVNAASVRTRFYDNVLRFGFNYKL